MLLVLLSGLLLGALGGFLVGRRVGRGARRVARKPMKPALVPLAAHSPRRGAADALVTIVEFTDFQCPFCGRAQSTLQRISKEYDGQVAIVLRHHPLDFHKDAPGAAAAMQAAYRQSPERAWALHDKMFEHRKQLSSAALQRYAADVGLDIARFKDDVVDPTIVKQVETDKELALKIGATGTPSFFINGRPIRGAQPFEAFKEIIDAELKAARTLREQGVADSAIYETRAKANSEEAQAG